MFTKKLFGKNIEQNCSYCSNSDTDKNNKLFCKVYSSLNYGKKCKKFKYDPLKRKPNSSPKIPKYDPSEFDL